MVSALPPPPHPRFIIDRNLGYFFLPLTLVDKNFEYRNVDNWLPTDQEPAIYAFDWHADVLRPFYQNLFGVRRVQSFGRAFMIRLEARDWSWVREYGWAYEARCQKRTWRGQVPVLFHSAWTFGRMQCKDPVTHTWRGRWNGPGAHLRLRFSGNTTVHTSTDGRVVQQDGREQSAEFDVQPDAIITVTITTPRLPDVALLEVTPGAEHVPVHDRVSPVPSP